MWTLEETVSVQTASSQSSSSSAQTVGSESYSLTGSYTGSVADPYPGPAGTVSEGETYASASAYSVSQNAAGCTVEQNGTRSWSESGSYISTSSYSTLSNETFEATPTNSIVGYTFTVTNITNSYSTSGESTVSSSFLNTGSVDSSGSSSGGTTETNGSQTTAGATQSSSGDSVALRTTAAGTGESTASIFTTTFTFQTTVPTLTNTGGGITTIATSATASGITSSQDSSHYLNGVYGTTTSASGGGVVRASAYVFAFSEDAWLLRLDESFAGMQELSDFAQHLDSSYEIPTSTLGSTTVGITPTSTFQSMSEGLSATTTAATYVGVSYGDSSDSSSTAALATPPQAIPNTTQESDYTSQTTTSQTYEQGVLLGSATSTSGSATGQSASSVASSFYNATASVPTFAFDDQGRITGTTSAVSQVLSSTTLAAVYVATTGGDSQTATSFSSAADYTPTNTDFPGNGGGGTTESGSTSAYGATVTSVAPVYSATSFLPQGTILEATFDPAVRFGTDGKYDSVDGPGGTWFYPFWSQVWGGLWMPMTYAQTRTATYQNQISTADPYDPDYTYLVPTGPTISASYRWSGGLVSMTTGTGSGTATGTGSTQFAMQAAGQDDHSYSTSRGAGLNVSSTDQYGDAGIEALGGDYVAGGTQWNDQPAQLWLGSGIWALTSYDTSGGSSTAAVTVTDPVSISMVASSVVVAARPIPSWQCCTASPSDPCLALFTAAG